MSSETPSQKAASPVENPAYYGKHPRHRGGPHSVYVPRKPLADPLCKTEPISALFQASVQDLPPKSGEEALPALKEKLQELVRTCAELKAKVEAADEEFKSAAFAKSRAEHERSGLDRDLKAKAQTADRLSEENARTRRQLQEIQEKVVICEDKIAKLQNDNTQILQAILEKDKKINEMSADSSKAAAAAERQDRAVNTTESFAPGTESEEPGNGQLIEACENYRTQFARSQSAMDALETQLIQARQKEDTLLGEKGAAELELAELRSVIRSLGKPRTGDTAKPSVLHEMRSRNRKRGRNRWSQPRRWWSGC